MRKLSLRATKAGALALALASAAISSPSIASFTFSTATPSSTIHLGGDQPGTSSNLQLTLAGYDSATNKFTFDYTLTNNSSTVTNPLGRVSGFGFGTSADPLSAQIITSNGTQLNAFANAILEPPSGQLTSLVEVCFANNSGNSCSGPGGATVGSAVQGEFALVFPNHTGTSLTLDDFGVRYQSLGTSGEGSGRGFEDPVPEPATWALMLLGFGGMGFSLRRGRRSRKTRLMQIA
jgi:hypothetical protein